MDEKKFKEKLNPEQYRIMREHGTEMPYVGKYWDHEESGVYFCAACGNKLFSSLAKFRSGEGWPAFRNPTSGKDVDLKPDGKGGTEVACRKCGSHLGEITGEGDKKYYRINSAALDFREVGIEFEEKEKEGEGDEKKKKEGRKGERDTRVNNPTAKTISLVVGGIAVGAIAGGSIGIALCHRAEISYEGGNATIPPTALVQPTNALEVTPGIGNSVSPPRIPATPKAIEDTASSRITVPESATAPQPRGTVAAPTESSVTGASVPPPAPAFETDDASGGTPVGGGAVSDG